MAIWACSDRLDNLIHHSDQGSQHTSIRYTERLVGAGAVCSVGIPDDSYDNAREICHRTLQNRAGPEEEFWKTVGDLEITTLMRPLTTRKNTV